MNKLIVIRSVTPEECPWLSKAVVEGTIVTKASDPYGCCSPAGTMVAFSGEDCHSELPNSALRPYQQALN